MIDKILLLSVFCILLLDYRNFASFFVFFLALIYGLFILIDNFLPMECLGAVKAPNF